MNSMIEPAAMTNPFLPTASGEQVFRPHDLLWVADWHSLHADSALPSWANMDWLSRAPVVVRRERVGDSNLIPVGLRGTERSQRLGAYLERSTVLRRISPETLARQAAWRSKPHLQRFPAIVALERAHPLLNASGLRWGPGGGVGYALASGVPVLRADSDLDLLVRAATPLTPDQTRLLKDALDVCECRIDMQIDTGYGGFSFLEWIREGRQVLLKTDMGPFMTGDPWKLSGWPEMNGADLI
jgi:phosphoribosyl-dephospho-CoA transferase